MAHLVEHFKKRKPRIRVFSVCAAFFIDLKLDTHHAVFVNGSQNTGHFLGIGSWVLVLWEGVFPFSVI